MSEDPLYQLKVEFLDGMRDTLSTLEKHILTFEKPPLQTEHVMGMTRLVHSIKGAGGSYEMPFLSRISHQWEDEFQGLIQSSPSVVSPVHVEDYLKYVDLMRQVCDAYRKELDLASNSRVFEIFEPLLVALRTRANFRILLVDSSRTAHRLVSTSLAGLPVSITWCTDGYTALGKMTQMTIDIAIVAKSVPIIEGSQLITCIAALGGNRRPQTVLLTSDSDVTPCLSVWPDHILVRDHKMPENLHALVNQLLSDRTK